MAGGAFIAMRRTFFFCRRTASASGSKAGATTTSRKRLPRASARDLGKGRLTATMPPKALSGSQAQALSKAAWTSAPAPTPEGVTCLKMTAAGPSNSQTASQVPKASRRLL